MDPPTGLLKVEDAEGGRGACGFLFGEVRGSKAPGCLLETGSSESFVCSVLGVLGKSVFPVPRIWSERGSLTNAVSFLTGAPEGSGDLFGWFANGSFLAPWADFFGGRSDFIWNFWRGAVGAMYFEAIFERILSVWVVGFTHPVSYASFEF